MTREFWVGATLDAETLEAWGGAAYQCRDEAGYVTDYAIVPNGHDWEAYTSLTWPDGRVVEAPMLWRVDSARVAAEMSCFAHLPVWLDLSYRVGPGETRRYRHDKARGWVPVEEAGQAHAH